MAEYTYNGLNFRTGWHYDVTQSGGGAPDGTVDGSDPWYWFIHNERWQVVGTFRGSDANPKERFIYHGAGLGGRGGSSYIDAIVCNDRDMTNGWAGAADGTLEARFYINQNWRGDVAVVTDDVGMIQERIKYSAYGVPTCLASADYDRNGVVNSTDDTNFQADLTALDPLSDFNFDGATDFFDYLDFTAAYSTQLGESNGRGVLSRGAVGNRFGYAGYQWDPAIAGAAVIGGKWHVRHRVLDAERGTWLTRDPLGYHDGEDLYEYVRGGPVAFIDPNGLQAVITCAKAGPINCVLGGCLTTDFPVSGCLVAGWIWFPFPPPILMRGLICLSMLAPRINIPCPPRMTCLITARSLVSGTAPASHTLTVSTAPPCFRNMTCLSGFASFIQETGVCVATPGTAPGGVVPVAPPIGIMPADPL